MRKSPKEVKIVIEPGTIIRVLVYIVIATLALMLLMRISQSLVILLISFFLAVALNPAVSWIASKLKSKSRVRATGAAYLMVIAVLTAFVSLVFPPLISQTIDFAKEIPATVSSFTAKDGPFNAIVQRYQLEDEISQITKDIAGQANNLSAPALATAGKIGSTVVNTVAVFVLTFMMLVEGPAWIKIYFGKLSPKKHEHQQYLLKKMYKVIVGYVNGQVLIAAIGGTFAAIALFIGSQIFNVSVNAIALGGIITLFALLPLIGTTLGAIIVVLSTLIVSWPLAVFMAVYFVIYQQIENVTLQPFIQSRTNTLTPLLVFISALLGVGIGGIVGAILAIPAAGCIKILVDDYFERRRAISEI